jgi:hypothetical protein
VALVVGVSSNTVITLDSNIFTAASQNYAIYKSSTAVEAEKVNQSKSILLNTSLLTAPSALFPAYSQQTDVLTISPVSYKQLGQVVANYFRYPKVPKWTYITLVSGEPAFDQSQPDFELPIEYEYRLILKILQYAGLSIRESEVVQYGMVKEQQQAKEQ